MATSAEREARRGLALWPEGGDARYALGTILVFSGRTEEARPHVDTLLALYPNDHSGKALREWLRQATTAPPGDSSARRAPRN
jgi:tetratricopeptide (TPR) repeat protein